MDVSSDTTKDPLDDHHFVFVPLPPDKKDFDVLLFEKMRFVYFLNLFVKNDLKK